VLPEKSGNVKAASRDKTREWGEVAGGMSLRAKGWSSYDVPRHAASPPWVSLVQEAKGSRPGRT